MNINRWRPLVLIVGLASSSLLVGQTQNTPAPDNTKNNQTDNTKTTADQQKQNRTDVDITQQIRQLVTKDKLLSTNAKNVKIITQDGKVTLAGPVNSEDEKKSVEAKAIQVAGAGHVKNEIQITRKQPEKTKP